ncbi:MAG TPA: HEAT repeat domain-containing protein, partial [Gemmataceae bacterium]|nr:HEAT repeat domain-containing protein [Gemmataceae bacterium]
ARYPGPYPMLAGAAMSVPNSPGPFLAPPPANGMGGVAQAGYARAASNSGALLATLRDDLYPSQREYAAECLATSETKANTQAVEALMIAAKSDPAATVRAACVRCLTKMNVNGPAMIAMLHSLKTDADPRVRQAADQALSKSK